MGKKVSISQFYIYCIFLSGVFLFADSYTRADNLKAYFSPFGGGSIITGEISVADAGSFDKEALKLEKQGIDLFWEEQKPEEAIEVFNKAFEKEPRLVYAPMYIGLYYRAIEKDNKKAERALEKAIEYHPEIPRFYVELAETYLAFDKHEDAIKNYKSALKAGFPEQAGIFYNIGKAYFDLEEYEDCIEYCSIAMSLDPRHDKCKNVLVRAYILEEQEGKAFELIGDRLTFHKFAAALYLDNGNNDKAMREVERALDLDPQDNEATFYKALILQNEGQFEKSVEELNRILQTEPKNHEVLLHKGICLAELGRVREALGIFNNLDSRYPQDTRAKCMIGSVYYRQGRYDESLEVFEKVWSIEPGNIFASMMIKTISELVR